MMCQEQAVITPDPALGARMNFLFLEEYVVEGHNFVVCAITQFITQNY